MSRKTCTTGTDNTGFSDNINKVFFIITETLNSIQQRIKHAAKVVIPDESTTFLL